MVRHTPGQLGCLIDISKIVKWSMGEMELNTTQASVCLSS